MAEEITPALTPEEWARARGGLDVDVGGEIYWGNPTFFLDDEPQAIRLTPTLDETRYHAVAALALHGQPFGFTREDVAALEALYRMGCTCGVITAEDGVAWNDAQARVPGVIARISALLPPESP